MIVTDGEAGDQNLVERYTPEVVARGVVVDVIGVDMKSRHTLATKVHSYRAANDPESLKKAIQEVFAEVSDERAKQNPKLREEIADLLDGLPEGISVAMITSLSDTGNHAIGTKPKPKPRVVKQTPAPAPSTTSQQTTQPSQQQQQPGASQESKFPCFVVGIVIAVFAVLAIAAFAKLS